MALSSSFHFIVSYDLARSPRKPRIPRNKKKKKKKKKRRRRRRASQSQKQKQQSRENQSEMPEQEADDDFTFPTPPQLHGRTWLSPSFSSYPPPPSWLQLSSPIRRSFSADDCAASPWRAPRGGACCSPALSDCGAAFSCHDEEEELMDSLWEDLNDDEAPPAAAGEKHDLFLDVPCRRSFGGPGPGQTAERTAEVLAASRSSRRRPPGLVVMIRALKKMFVAHMSRSKVHKADDQSTASAPASSSSSTNSCNKGARHSTKALLFK